MYNCNNSYSYYSNMNGGTTAYPKDYIIKPWHSFMENRVIPQYIRGLRRPRKTKDVYRYGRGRKVARTFYSYSEYEPYTMLRADYN